MRALENDVARACLMKLQSVNAGNLSRRYMVNGSSRNDYLLKMWQNLSGMEVRTFVRIQKVMWEKLLPCKAEIIHT